MSGKTLLRNLLNKHHDIAAFGEAKITNTMIFLNFPIQIFECQPHLRTRLINIFKQQCTTYLYCRLRCPEKSFVDKAWLYFEKIWISRLQSPQSFVWNNPFWSILEKLWLPKLLKRFICVHSHKKGSAPAGWRGLHEFIKKKDIRDCFVHLDPLNNVISLNEAYRIYGDFWNCIFNIYAKNQKKKYWAEDTPVNTLHSLFLKKCFTGFKLITVIRDGRDAACFCREEWGYDIKKLLDVWARHIRKTMKDQSHMTPDDYINIRYEDLVNNTQITLKKITGFLEVDFDKAMLSFPINSLSVGRYKYELNPELKNYAKDRYGSLLNQWGYSI